LQYLFIINKLRNLYFKNSEDKITEENINKILDFIPYFESKDSVFYTVDTADLLNPHIYSRNVLDFGKTLYEENIVCVFDWGSWQSEAEKYFKDAGLLKDADLDTLRKLLTLHVRKERFCSGHLAHMIESGHILSILKRIKDIKFQLFST
jgi:O-acetyl-ADP-ribose deacetylase